MVWHYRTRRPRGLRLEVKIPKREHHQHEWSHEGNNDQSTCSCVKNRQPGLFQRQRCFVNNGAQARRRAFTLKSGESDSCRRSKPPVGASLGDGEVF